MTMSQMPSGADPLFILTHRSAVRFTSLREWAAITVYRVSGKIGRIRSAHHPSKEARQEVRVEPRVGA